MYLDPGFGGMLIQIILALVAAGGVVVFTLRKKIKALFSGKKNNTQIDNGAINNTDSSDEFIDTISDKK